MGATLQRTPPDAKRESGLRTWLAGLRAAPDGRPLLNDAAARGYAVAVLLSLASAGVRLAATPHIEAGARFLLFEARTGFLLFVPALVVCTVLGAGGGPALVTTALGLAAAAAGSGWGLVQDPAYLGRAATFVLLGLLCAGVAHHVARDRRQKEQAVADLEASAAHLNSIFAAVPDAMVVIDDRGLIRAFSAAAERMFGWSAAEAMGLDVSMLAPAADRAGHKEALQRYLRTGDRRIIDIGRTIRGARRDGSTFPADYSVGEVNSAEQRLFTVFARDVSERQQVQQRLEQLQAELAHVARLAAMGEMASALAHELNQPLAAVTNYVAAASRFRSMGPASEALADISLRGAAEQALRAGEIIRRVRDYVAKRETAAQPQNLRALIEDAASLAMVAAKDRETLLRFDLPDRAAEVQVDKVQIQQVVLNLLRNGLEAMEGSPRREIVVSARQGERFVEVTVADTGPGVSETLKAGLFEPFSTSKPHGLGVGLSISKRIVEAHGGRIWLAQAPGGGAAFKFTVPRVSKSGMHDAA